MAKFAIVVCVIIIALLITYCSIQIYHIVKSILERRRKRSEDNKETVDSNDVEVDVNSDDEDTDL